MSWKARIGFIAFGVFLCLAASAQVQAGRFVFDNGSYHQTTYAWSGYGVGAVSILVASLPPSSWVKKFLASKKSKRISPKRR